MIRVVYVVRAVNIVGFRDMRKGRGLNRNDIRNISPRMVYVNRN